MEKRISMPKIGLGTWKLRGDECERVVRQALELGYRHIDTADAYENHRAIGRALDPSLRDQVFLTSKLWMNDLEPANVDRAVSRFLEELNVDYLDLLLIHWPNPEANLTETLQEMLELKKKGLIRFIGVSNFVRFHLDELAPYHFPVLTNQIELHPYLQRKLLVQKCKEMGISITAYRPLAKGAFEDDPVLQKIGKKYGKTASQIVLRWLVQQDFYAIPKAASLQHLKDNLNIFDFSLTDAEMEIINGLDAGKDIALLTELPFLKIKKLLIFPCGIKSNYAKICL